MKYDSYEVKAVSSDVMGNYTVAPEITTQSQLDKANARKGGRYFWTVYGRNNGLANAIKDYKQLAPAKAHKERLENMLTKSEKGKYTVVLMHRYTEEVVTTHINSQTVKGAIRRALRENEGAVVVDIFEGTHKSVSPSPVAMSDCR